MYTGLSRVEALIPPPHGIDEIRWEFDDDAGKGSVVWPVPAGSRGAIYAPDGWIFAGDVENPQCIE